MVESRPNSALRRRLEECASSFGGQLLFDEPLARHTYYRIGGSAEVLAIPRSLEDLALLTETARECRVPVFVLGLGSNLLVSDHGFQGLVVKVTRLDLTMEVQSGDTAPLLRTGGSVAISSLLRRAAAEGWGGFELWAGVPGSIGGAVRMNAGTHLGESKDILHSVDVFLGFCDPDETRSLGIPDREGLTRFGPDTFRFDYRRNLFLPRAAVVVSAEWRFRFEDPAVVKARVDEMLARRKATQPVEFPSCGSVFKNPRESGLSAWQVIDRLGLRGHRIGGAQFSEKHPNFIVNRGDARATDVRALIELAKVRAAQELGVTLHEEVIYLGRFGDDPRPA